MVAERRLRYRRELRRLSATVRLRERLIGCGAGVVDVRRLPGAQAFHLALEVGNVRVVCPRPGGPVLAETAAERLFPVPRPPGVDARGVLAKDARVDPALGQPHVLLQL